MIRDKGYGVKFIPSLSKMNLHLVGMGFVDDTGIIGCGLKIDKYEDVTQRLQEVLQW